VAAITRQRVLSSGGAGLAKLVDLGKMVGAWGSLIGAAALLWAAFVAL